MLGQKFVKKKFKKQRVTDKVLLLVLPLVKIVLAGN